MKKLLSLILCISIALFAVACGEQGDPDVTEDGKVIIRIPEDWGGGVGTEGTRANADLFEADPNWGNKAYGKYTGVKVELVPGEAPKDVDSLKTTAFSLTSVSRGQTNLSEIKDGLAPLDDLYASTFPGEDRTLEEKVFPEYRKYFQGGDGHYYGLANNQIHCGYALNTQLWEKDQLYIAAAKVDGDTNFDESIYEDYWSYHSSTFGCTLYFSDYDGDGNGNYPTVDGRPERNGKWQTSKDDLCVGPDGKKGTMDDGQPSSVVEFLTLCEYMEAGVTGILADPRPGEGRGNTKFTNYDAICYSGKYKSGYDALFLDAFFANLAGGDGYDTVLKFDSEGREVEVVVGYSTENLYPGISYIKKPITKKVKITPECGYYATWMVEKYYTEAVMKILQTQGDDKDHYFYYGTENSSSHVDAQWDFIYGLYENSAKQSACAYIIDGSYLNNEMRLNGHFDLLLARVDTANDPRMEFAVPPTSIDKPVTCEEEGDDPVLVPISRSANIIPKAVEKDPDKLAAVKAFLLYMRSDVAMARTFMYTGSIGIMLGDSIMDVIENNPSAHLADHEYFNYYKHKYIEYYSTAYAVDNIKHPIGGEYINSYTNPDLYKRGYGSGVFYVGARDSCWTSLTLESGIKNTFEGSMYFKNTWDKVYKGTQAYASVPEEQKSYNGVVYNG